MSVFQVTPGDMSAASSTVSQTAGDARVRDSASHLATAAAALPGSSSADLLPELGASWSDELDVWSDAVESFGTSVEATGGDARTTDAASRGLFAGLLGLLGGR